MGKLIITADIHGSYSAWQNITSVLKQGDCLAIAGDLFDTVYGSDGHPDFQPGKIKNELNNLGHHSWYVYGNCDSHEFYPGQDHQIFFKFGTHTLLLNHGHLPLPDLTDYDIIIEGHTHIARLETLMGKVFLNPGSPVLPRSNGPTYAVLEKGTITIVDAETGSTIRSLSLD